jgi:hypothetical protein
MSTTKTLDASLRRLQDVFPPKHPDRRTMRPHEARKLVANHQQPVVVTNGWQMRRRPGTSVNWAKQERIPVGQPDMSLWGPPPVRGQGGKVRAGKGRGNKGPKNSGR